MTTQVDTSHNNMARMAPDIRRRLVGAVGRLPAVRKVGALYVLALIIVVFSVWTPRLFDQWATVRQVTSGNAVAGMAALTLTIPLATGVFDISGAYTMSLSGVITADLLVNSHFALLPSLIIAMIASVVIGVVNGFVIVFLNVDPLIATLGTGSLIQSFTLMVSHGGDSITGPQLTSDVFAKIAQQQLFGITLPVYYVIVEALLIWILLEHTASGRRIYATGFNRNAARLAGVNTKRLRLAALVVSSTLAGLAGIVLASSIGSGQPTSGTPYLLSAFAAVFLGATQLKEGRFNAWGTVIAVVVLGVGTTGLGLANSPSWAGSMFTGVVLIAALGITSAERRGIRKSRSAPTVPPKEESFSSLEGPSISVNQPQITQVH